MHANPYLLLVYDPSTHVPPLRQRPIEQALLTEKKGKNRKSRKQGNQNRFLHERGGPGGFRDARFGFFSSVFLESLTVGDKAKYTKSLSQHRMVKRKQNVTLLALVTLNLYVSTFRLTLQNSVIPDTAFDLTNNYLNTLCHAIRSCRALVSTERHTKFKTAQFKVNIQDCYCSLTAEHNS